MTYRAVLVQVEPDAARLSPVHVAVSVAKMFDAAVIGVGAATFDGLVEAAYPYVDAPVRRALLQELRGEMSRLEGWFHAIAGSQSPSALWRPTAAHPSEAVLRVAIAADLIVAGHPGKGDPSACADVGTLVMDSGAPVLLVPEGCEALQARRIVVGWKTPAKPVAP